MTSLMRGLRPYRAWVIVNGDGQFYSRFGKFDDDEKKARIFVTRSSLSFVFSRIPEGLRTSCVAKEFVFEPMEVGFVEGKRW